MSTVSVKQLKMKVVTNINDEPFELTFSKIYNPTPIQFLRKAMISTYPFFTFDIEYPAFLESKPYNELLYIFFDKQEFIRVIVNNEDRPIPAKAAPTSNEDRMAIANKNVMVMLKLLLPINYPVKNNLNTSYNKYLLKKGPDIHIDIEDVASLVYSGTITPGKHKYSYLNTDKGVCTITEIIWLNDLLNNKLYRDLINELIKYTEWAKTQNKIIHAEIEDITTKLQDDLKENNPLHIGNEEIEQLQGEKRIYNPDDMKEDIRNKILESINVKPDADKTKIFETELDEMIEYFLNTYILDKPTISQFTRFKDKFDFAYVENPPPSGKTPPVSATKNLFFLHNRYNNEDITVKITDLDTKIASIQKSLDENQTMATNLQDPRGYIAEIDKKQTFVVSAKILNRYIELLEEIKDELNTRPNTVVMRSVGAANKLMVLNKIKTLIRFEGQQPPNDRIEFPDLSDILIIDTKQTPKPTTHIAFISKVPNKINSKATATANTYGEYDNNKDIYINTDARSTTETFISDINEHIEKVQAHVEQLENDLATVITNIETQTAEIVKLTTEKNMLSDSNYIQKTRKLFSFKSDDTDTSELPVSDLKNALAIQITEIQDQIFKSVIVKYNRFKEIGRGSETLGKYSEIDSSIDRMVDEIINLNKLTTTTSNSTSTVNKILDITEKIKSIFDKLTSARQITISKTLGDKIAKILQLSNQIQILNAMETMFFPDPPTGIFVNYEKDLDKTASITEKLLKEIVLPKYANFIEIVAYIKKEFLQNEVNSVNTKLNNMINNYFANKSNDFYTRIIFPASQLINKAKGYSISYSSEDWDVSVSTLKSSTSKGELDYQISLFIELIEGELNEKNQSGIKCQFLDEELTRRFESLIDNDNSFEHTTNKQVFSIKDAQTKLAKKEEEKKAEIEKAKSEFIKPENTAAPPAIEASGGTFIQRKSGARSSHCSPKKLPIPTLVPSSGIATIKAFSKKSKKHTRKIMKRLLHLAI